MRLQAREAVDDVRAGALEGAGPLDVALLVEAGLHLDQADRLLALLGGAHQGRDDRRVAARAVHGLLDREDVGVLDRLLDEALDAGVEVVVGVVHQDVAAADDGEDVELLALLRPQAGPGARLPAGVAQPRPVHSGQRPERREIERRADAEGVAAGHLERLHQVLDEALGGVLLHLEAHDVAEAAAAQLRLDRAEEVVRLVGDREVRVARDPEARGVEHLHPGEEPADVRLDDVLERDQAVVDRQEARQPRRHLDAGEAGLALDGVADAQPEVEREPGDVGEGQPGAHRERREDRVDLAVELDVHLTALVGRELGEGDDVDARPGERGADLLAPDAALLGRQLAHPRGDPVEDLLAGELVGRRRPPARLERVLHRRHPHHEELVEVAGEDREELAALEERHAGIARQGQHARVEVEPRQLAVDVEGGIRQVGRDGGVVGGAHRLTILDPATAGRKPWASIVTE